jgi:hypothetical protein
MKLAGFLALVLAVALGIWTISDYFENRRAQERNVEALSREVTRELKGVPASNDAMEESRRIEAAQRDDAIMGIVAACALIGSVVLFSKSKAAVVAS